MKYSTRVVFFLLLNWISVNLINTHTQREISHSFRVRSHCGANDSDANEQGKALSVCDCKDFFVVGVSDL